MKFQGIFMFYSHIFRHLIKSPSTTPHRPLHHISSLPQMIEDKHLLINSHSKHKSFAVRKIKKYRIWWRRNFLNNLCMKCLQDFVKSKTQFWAFPPEWVERRLLFQRVSFNFLPSWCCCKSPCRTDVKSYWNTT